MIPDHEMHAEAMLQQIRGHIDNVCDILGTDARVRERLKVSKRVTRALVSLPRGPKEEHYYVIRVRHLNPWATAQQPYGGGLRYHPEVSTPLMEVDAMKMTFKHALVGPEDHQRVPFGGAKGGVAVDPYGLKPQELVLLTQKVVQALGSAIGPRVDRVAPDMGTNERIMDEFMTYYATLNEEKHIPCGAIASGKSPDNSGIRGRLWATAAGMYDVLNFFRGNESTRNYFGDKPTAIIIGAGNVGGWFLRLARKNGISVIGITDVKGTLYRASGGLENEAEAILDCTQSKGSVQEYRGGEHPSVEELLSMPCTLLVPAAKEGMITPAVASRLHARAILEGANNPTTEDAMPVLRDHDVLLIPDILANAGGATVSYFEWRQGIEGVYFTDEEIENSRAAYMIGGARRTVEAAQKYGTDLRMGAMIASIDFIARRLTRKRHWDLY